VTPVTDRHERNNGGAYGHDLARRFEALLAQALPWIDSWLYEPIPEDDKRELALLVREIQDSLRSE
jgi:hypothetical protein